MIKFLIGIVSLCCLFAFSMYLYYLASVHLKHFHCSFVTKNPFTIMFISFNCRIVGCILSKEKRISNSIIIHQLNRQSVCDNCPDSRGYFSIIISFHTVNRNANENTKLRWSFFFTS